MQWQHNLDLFCLKPLNLSSYWFLGLQVLHVLFLDFIFLKKTSKKIYVSIKYQIIESHVRAYLNHKTEHSDEHKLGKRERETQLAGQANIYEPNPKQK